MVLHQTTNEQIRGNVQKRSCVAVVPHNCLFAAKYTTDQALARDNRFGIDSASLQSASCAATSTSRNHPLVHYRRRTLTGSVEDGTIRSSRVGLHLNSLYVVAASSLRRPHRRGRLSVSVGEPGHARPALDACFFVREIPVR
jgi:hypothetical protein